MKNEEDETPTPGSAAMTWWAGLAFNRGARARLRRSASVADVQLSEPFVRLLRETRAGGQDHASAGFPNEDAVAAAAIVIARLPGAVEDEKDEGEGASKPRSFRINSAKKLFEALAAPRGKASADDDVSPPRGGSPVFSRLRFTRLLRTPSDDPDAIVQGFSRAIESLKPKPHDISPAAVFDVVAGWGRDDVRRRAAYAYWSRIIDTETPTNSKGKAK